MKDSEKEKRSWMFDDGGGWLSGGLFLRSRAGIESRCDGMVGAGLCDKGLLFCCCGDMSPGDFAPCIYSTYRPSPPRRPLALSLDCSTLLQLGCFCHYWKSKCIDASASAQTDLSLLGWTFSSLFDVSPIIIRRAS